MGCSDTREPQPNGAGLAEEVAKLELADHGVLIADRGELGDGGDGGAVEKRLRISGAGDDLEMGSEQARQPQRGVEHVHGALPPVSPVPAELR